MLYNCEVVEDKSGLSNLLVDEVIEVVFSV